jgi:peptide chain release factor subunit 3
LKSTGFEESDLVFVPIVGLTGENINQKVDPHTCNWYQGPTLLEILD